MIAPTVLVNGTAFRVTVGSLFCRYDAAPLFVDIPLLRQKGS